MDELLTTYGEQGIIAELTRRDKIRGDKIGDASVFENYVNRYINLKSQKFNSFVTISPEKFMDTYVKPVNLSQWMSLTKLRLSEMFMVTIHP